MGVMGYEGSFRRASEVTLQILRQHEDMLMTILETFLHDPIVDWAVKRHRRTVSIFQSSHLRYS
jgi:phosphatidylinositol kinase/protein kinase (PI-3  family)